jgi:hypothetical protein
MAMKLDLKAARPDLYRPAREVALVDVPAFPFLMVDGAGDPNTATAYCEAVEALYSVAYTLKFALKKAGAEALDYVVLPLEGLWWLADGVDYAPESDRALWRWTMMIRQPDVVTSEHVAAACAAAARKKALPALALLRFESFTEGRAAQVMHTGPYSEEGPTIARLHDFITAQGHQFTGKHHELYLSDPKRTAPERLKTILRQPIG